MFGINLERENQKKEETEKVIREKNFYNSYYIINTTDNRIEAVYEGEIYADFMLRNFSEYFPHKNFIVVQTSNQIGERPTNKQLFRILQIENGYRIPYTGLTRESASHFLDRHIDKTKKFDEEYRQVK